MAMLQLRLIPLYRTLPYGIGYGEFGFFCAAVVTNALHWLPAEQTPLLHAPSYTVLALLTVGTAVLISRTLVALSGGTCSGRPAHLPWWSGVQSRNRGRQSFMFLRNVL